MTGGGAGGMIRRPPSMFGGGMRPRFGAAATAGGVQGSIGGPQGTFKPFLARLSGIASNRPRPMPNRPMNAIAGALKGITRSATSPMPMVGRFGRR